MIGVMLSMALYSQDGWESNTGEIEDVEVQIIKDREITLLKANRNFEKINPTFSPVAPAKFEYKFQEFDFDIPDLTFRLRPLRIKNERLQKLYGGYLKAGFGNFGTPYLEGYVNNKRDQQYAYGAHVKHLSSKSGAIDDDNSGVSESQVDVFGKIFTKKAVLGGSLGFGQDRVHFYGYPEGTTVAADDIKQRFSKINVNGFVKSNNSVNDPSYQLGVGYRHISDDFDAKEGIFSSKFDLSYPVGGESNIKLAADVQVISRTDSLVSDSRLVVGVQPTYQFIYNNFKIEAGLNATYENDTLENMGKLHLYPVLKAAYDISDQVELYAGFDGGIVTNTYHNVIDKTPFLRADVPIYHTNRLYQFAGGVRARVGKSSHFHTGFSMGGYRYFQTIINTPSDPSRFELAYDLETSTTVNIFGEWGLSKSNKLQLSLRGDYFGYNMGTLLEAWHQPQFKISAFAKYNLYDKIIIETNLYTMGGIKAYDANTNASIDLDTIVDFNIEGTYLFSDQFSIFIKLNNILSQEYQLLNRYPVRGFQAIGGISYTF